MAPLVVILPHLLHLLRVIHLVQIVVALFLPQLCARVRNKAASSVPHSQTQAHSHHREQRVQGPELLRQVPAQAERVFLSQGRGHMNTGQSHGRNVAGSGNCRACAHRRYNSCGGSDSCGNCSSCFFSTLEPQTRPTGQVQSHLPPKTNKNE